MYGDIADSNTWGWLPQEVRGNNLEYSEYNKVIQRFISYVELVDQQIQPKYRYVVDKFNSGYKDSERPDVFKRYQDIREFSKNKAIELGGQLRTL